MVSLSECLQYLVLSSFFLLTLAVFFFLSVFWNFEIETLSLACFFFSLACFYLLESFRI